MSALAAAVLMGAGSASFADTVYDSGGFESPRFAPTVNLAGQDPLTPWQKDAGTSTAVVQTNSPKAGLQSVRVQRAAAATGDTRWWVQSPVTAPPALGVINIDFDMNVSIAPVLTYGPLFGVEAYDASGAAPKMIGGLMLDAAQGRVLYGAAGSGAATSTGKFLARNTYHHFTLSADFTSKTYSVYANDTLLHVESFVDPTATAFTYAPIFTASPTTPSATGTGYFENYIVSHVASSVPGGVWINPAGGAWSVPTNWDGGTVADGADVITNFSTLDLPAGADVAVQLDSARTVGHLVFGDTDASSAAGWALSAIPAVGKLTLSAPRSAPSITVAGLANGKAVTISAVLEGTEGFTKGGAGTLVLSGANTYGGDTTINNGTLRLGAAGAIPDGAGKGNVVVNDGATFDLGGFDETITGLSSAPSHTTGVVTNSAAGAKTLTIGSADASSAFNGVIQDGVGPVALAKTGSGSVTLGGANTYTGGTTVNGGSLVVASNGALGTGAITHTAGSVQLANGVTLSNAFASTGAQDGMIDVPDAGATATFAGNVSAGQFRPAASGAGATLVLTGNAALNAQPFAVSRGNVTVAGTSSISSTVPATIGRANASAADVSFTVKDNASLTVGGLAMGDATTNLRSLAVTVQNGGTLNVNGTLDLLNVSGSTLGSTLNLNGGTTTVHGFAKTTTSSPSTINFNGGTLKAGASNASFLPARGGLTAQVRSGGAIIDTNGFDVAVDQPIVHDPALDASPDGGLTKHGTGVLKLSGASTYTGPTVINGGTVQLPAPSTPAAVGSYSFDDVRDLSGNPVSTGSLGLNYVVANGGSGGTAMNGTVNHLDHASDKVNGGATLVAGKFGKALRLDGAGSSVDINSNIVDQGPSGNWTLSTWVKTATPGSAFVSKNKGQNGWTTGDSVFYLGSNPISGTPGQLPTAVRFAGGFLQGDQPVADNAWHQVTFVNNGGAETIYVDGVPTTLTHTAFDGLDSSTFVRLGYNVDSFANLDGNADFNGDLDEMKFFSVALTPQQIQELYAANTVTTGISTQVLPIGTPVNIASSGAALDLNGNNQAIGSLAGVAGSAVRLGNGTLTTGGNNTSTTFAGDISGGGGLRKAGTGTFTLAGANTYTGPTLVTEGTLRLESSLTHSSAIAADGGTLAIAPGQTRLIKTGSVAVSAGGKIDIADHQMIVSAPAGSAAGGVYSGVSGLVQSGLNGGTWDGSGIVTSQGDALTGLTTLAVATGQQVRGLAPGQTATWAGQTITATDTVVMYTYAGDANLDGQIDGDDYASIDFNSSSPGASGYFNGDFNYDGVINGDDYAAIDFAVSAQQAPFALSAGASPAAVTAVPEPAMLAGWAAIGGWALTRRRRRA